MVMINDLELLPTNKHPDVKINDPMVLAISDRDNGEPLISLQEMFDNESLMLPSQVRDQQHQVEGAEDTKTPFLRSGVKDTLMKAAALLDKRYTLVLIDAYRSYDTQKKLFDEWVTKLQAEDNSRSLEDIKKDATQFVSDPDLYSPHVTGAAVDVTLFDKVTGDYLDMGNLFEYDDKAADNCEGLTEAQQGNRQILGAVMRGVGLVNYSKEWWHWSTGDKYAAFIMGEESAQYGPIRLD